MMCFEDEKIDYIKLCRFISSYGLKLDEYYKSTINPRTKDEILYALNCIAHLLQLIEQNKWELQ